MGLFSQHHIAQERLGNPFKVMHAMEGVQKLRYIVLKGTALKSGEVGVHIIATAHKTLLGQFTYNFLSNCIQFQSKNVLIIVPIT